MIVVLFEVMVKKEKIGKYFSLAVGLEDELLQMDGFIRTERFTSLTNEGKLLSLSVWKSEQAVEYW